MSEVILKCILSDLPLTGYRKLNMDIHPGNKFINKDSRMSQLRLYRPRYFDNGTSEVDPVILSFPETKSSETKSIFSNAVKRAEVIYNNRVCPNCSHPEVEPLELDDGINNRNGVPIPGTCTLVGFHCLGCHAEWPV